MNGSNFRFRSGPRLSGIKLAGTLFCACAGLAMAQVPYQAGDAGKLLFKSMGALKSAEKVRASVPGVIVETYVKVGDVVKKGEVLGHTELDAAKLQLDLAKRALDNRTNVDAAQGQAEAWTVTREETANQVERRLAEKTRLEWATAMEKMYHANYEAQLELENVQQIQYDYAKDQYDKHFFRSPIDGVVTEVLVDVGKSVNYATHVFTISNDATYSIPVTVPAALADTISPNDKLPIRAADGKTVNRAVVDSVTENPRSTGEKIINLVVRALDFPAATRANLKGMKFDVLLPQGLDEYGR